MSYENPLCVRAGQFLLPSEKADMRAYAVIACDQYTAQPEYWARVREQVGDKPSALHMILPECYLSESQVRIPVIQQTMRDYLAKGILSRQVNGMVLLRRTTASGARLGLLMCVDLEQYDYALGSVTPIRATEGTITSRIPPRLLVRQHAALELSHILLLTDDPKRTIIEPVFAQKEHLKQLYDIDLMENGGRLEGWAVEDETILNGILHAVSDMQEAAGENGIVFAVGDGNHSLATARAHWLNVRETLTPAERETHPARFAMVEMTNLHDDALRFEPIHRVLFDVSAAAVKALLAPCKPVCDTEHPDVILVHEKGDLPLRITKSLHFLPVGTVQKLLDAKAGLSIDYVHGEDAVRALVGDQGAVGLLLPPIDKSLLFPAVSRSGVLPRKTFSMGEANEKRFYVEARRIHAE